MQQQTATSPTIPMRMAAVPDGRGGTRHMLVPIAAEPAKKGRKSRPKPAPIQAGAESSAQQLKLFIERLERLLDEIAEMQADVADVYAEAKATGFDTPTMRAIIALRKKEDGARQEADALMETYREALGLR